MEWVEKFIDRILDLGDEVKVEKHEARALCYDPVEYIKEGKYYMPCVSSALP